MNDLVITSIGTYLPLNSVDNEHLPALDPPLSLEKINAIGVQRRGHAAPNESVEFMAEAAARQALSRAGTCAEELDFLILVNWSYRRFVPDLAPRIQHLLGARNAMAFDVCCACCGFIQALSIAHGYLQQPRYSKGLIVAADRSTARMRPGSRATMIFGDGAAAAVVTRWNATGIRLVDYEIRTDGGQNDIMEVDADGYLLPHIRQRELNILAGKSMTEVSSALLARNQRTLEEIDWLVPHSGSAGVQAMLREYLGVSSERVLTTLPFQGNLAAAAIPCALRHFADSGQLRQGNRILAAAVGLGWQYAAMLLEIERV